MISKDFTYNNHVNLHNQRNGFNYIQSARTHELKADTVSFKGHLGAEKFGKNGINWLKHETALFRDMQTKEFVKDYIHKNFANNDKIKIIVGGCSTGEEALTHSMLFDSLKDKVKIIGFDLSKQSIESAESKKLLMQQLKETPEGMHGMFTANYSAFDDSFLCFSQKTNLTKEQIAQKKLFDEFFEISTEIPPKEKLSLSLKLKYWYLKKMFNLTPPVFESKYAYLKDNKANNIDFVTGDIMKLDKITKGEKADVITFTNAMYHIICKEFDNLGLRMPKKNAEEIVTKLAQGVKENLNGKKSIFVLGEQEVLQTMDTEIVPKVFKELGFNPLNATDDHAANVWQLL